MSQSENDLNGLNRAKRLNGLNVFRGLHHETTRRPQKLAQTS